MQKMEALLRESLHGIADQLVPTPEFDERVHRRMARHRRRQTAAAGLVAVAVLVAGGFGLTLALRWAGDHRPTVAPVPATTVAGNSPCEFAPVRPTYLPWLRPGQRVPAPQPSHVSPDAAAANPDTAALTWSRPGWETPPRVSYVQLRKETPTSFGGPGEQVPVAVSGAGSGQYHEGESPGSGVIAWDTGASRCGQVVLELQAPDLTRQQAKVELLRIARSLSPG